MHFNSIPLIVFLIIHRLSFLFGANIICYYPNWAFYRPGNDKSSALQVRMRLFVFFCFVADEYKMKIADLNAGLCTHAIYAFVGMHQENYTLKSTDTWADYDNNGFKDFAALKNVYPKLKIVIGVGGWGESNDGTAKFSKLAASSENTAAFIASVIKFLKDYNFDGVDFSWQFPPEADKANHAKLMSAIKSAFEPHGYLLSAAVSASTLKVEKGNYRIDPLCV